MHQLLVYCIILLYDTHLICLCVYVYTEISLTPSYAAVVGSCWLEKGGVYVTTNIRGGGMFIAVYVCLLYIVLLSTIYDRL